MYIYSVTIRRLKVAPVILCLNRTERWRATEEEASNIKAFNSEYVSTYLQTKCREELSYSAFGLVYCTHRPTLNNLNLLTPRTNDMKKGEGWLPRAA